MKCSYVKNLLTSKLIYGYNYISSSLTFYKLIFSSLSATNKHYF